MRSKDGVRWLKLGLSGFVAFHVFVLCVVPNSQSYLSMKLAPWVEGYVNFFEFTNAWSFFAPEPGPPPVFVEYELLDKNGDSFERGRWPETQSPYFLRERQNRKLAAVEFMMASEIRAEKMMVQYLCAHKPGARSLRVWRIMYTVPDFGEVLDGTRTIGDDVRMERKLVSHTFCEDSK